MIINNKQGTIIFDGDDLRGADLRDANLTGADLRDANLTGANLSRVNLSRVNLSRVNLSRANLSGADLSGADLRDANLTGADLTEADLSGADLSRVNLSRVNLSRANLRRANLRDANLTRANLSEAKLDSIAIQKRTILPEGDLIGWKKLADGTIAKLRIPANAKRVGGLTGRKCRAEFAIVLEGAGIAMHDSSFRYEPGQTVKPREPFNGDPREVCASGIHFYIARIEAEQH